MTTLHEPSFIPYEAVYAERFVRWLYWILHRYFRRLSRGNIRAFLIGKKSASPNVDRCLADARTMHRFSAVYWYKSCGKL